MPTQKQMSEATGISTAMLGFIIRDKFPVSAKLAKRISALTGKPWSSYCHRKKSGKRIEAEIIKAMEGIS